MITIIDKINGELICFHDKIDAQMELERRLIRHRHGYNIRHNHVPGCNAQAFIRGNNWYIAIREEDTL